MTEFLRLKLTEQADILSAISVKIGWSSQVLYKDVWVCWVLKKLFDNCTEVRMAFKGGTSLSKVFGLIHRFSEDIDITLDYQDLMPGLNPFEANTSKSQIKRMTKCLKERLREQVHNRILPVLSSSFMEVTGNQGTVDISEDGEKLWLRYPSPFASISGYVQDAILLEFGGRNVTEPNGPHSILPLLANEILALDFPVANVMVLDPKRTFWEKATLMHVECNRTRSSSVDRLSRHWYDLVMLGESEICSNAISDRALLDDVVAHKQVFFNASYAHYDDCLNGGFRLVPDESRLSDLEMDYEQMREAGMFDIEPPAFTEIVETLKAYEKRINCI